MIDLKNENCIIGYLYEQNHAHSHAKLLSIYIRWATSLILREKIVFSKYIVFQKSLIKYSINMVFKGFPILTFLKVKFKYF